MEIRTMNMSMPQAGIRPVADDGPILRSVENVEQVTVEAVKSPQGADAATVSKKAGTPENVPFRMDKQEKAEAPTKERIAEAMNSIKGSLESLSQSSGLKFAIDDESGRVVVKIMDPETQEVIKQFPSEEAVKLANTLSKLSEGLVREQA